jgi:uncharacterized membrane protein
MLAREVRVTDSTLIGNLVTSVTFYANTTIYIIAGLVAALGAADKLLSFTADLAFAGAGNREVAGDQADAGARQLRLRLLQVHLVAAPVQPALDPGRRGAARPARRAGHRRYARRVAGANNLAGDDFNRGIRAYYFGLAASGWLLSPLLLGVLALSVLIVLYRRDYRSAALDVLRGA